MDDWMMINTGINEMSEWIKEIIINNNNKKKFSMKNRFQTKTFTSEIIFNSIMFQFLV